MPPAPKFRTRRDRVGQFAPYEQKNARIQKTTKSDRVPIPGGYRLRKHALSIKTVYGNRGRAAPPLFSVTKHKDVDMSVVTVLYGKRANSPDLIDDEGSTDGGDTSDDGDDDSYEPGSTPPSTDSEDNGSDDGSAMDVTPPPTPNFGHHAAQTTAAGPSRQINAARLGPKPRNIIDLTVNN